MSLFDSLPLPSKQSQPSNTQQDTPISSTPSKTIVEQVPIINSSSIPSSANNQTLCSEDKKEENKQIITENSSTTTPAKPKGLSGFSLVPSSVKSKQTPRSNPFKSSSDSIKKIGTIIDEENSSHQTPLKRKLNNSTGNSTTNSDEYDPLIPNKYEEYLLKKLKKNEEEKIVLDELEEDELMLSTPNQNFRSTPASGKSSTKSTISFNLQKKTPNSGSEK